MFQRILVPLDGSSRAEEAIPVAARLARISGGSITLLRVVTHPLDTVAYLLQSPEKTEQALEEKHAIAANYLTHLADSHELAGVKTALEVVDSIPVQTILSAAHLQQVDSIVICSHGDSSLKRWALGSVAQKVARHSSVPVLLLHEETKGHTLLLAEHPHPVRVMVALDSSALAEASILPAAYLSAALSSPAHGFLHLIEVVSGFEDVAYDARKEAEAYLHTMEQRLRAEELVQMHVEVTSSVIMGMDVADTLVREAENGDGTGNSYDAIAMTTHGRHGTDLWIMGSVMERVLEATKLPLLIVRPQKMIQAQRMEIEHID